MFANQPQSLLLRPLSPIKPTDQPDFALTTVSADNADISTLLGTVSNWKSNWAIEIQAVDGFLTG